MFSNRLRNLHPYVPGEQPKDRDYIKLNANENPYPPHHSVCAALKTMLDTQNARLGLYPDPDTNELRDEIAKMLNSTGGVLCRATVKDDGTCISSAQDALPKPITRDMIFCGNGSDEVLSFVFYTFFDSDRPLVLPQFTYSFYPVYCGYYSIPMERIPLMPDWAIDSAAMISAAQQTDSCIVFANPNAPTGLALTRAQVAQILDKAPKNRIVVVDEAYCDFGGESCLPLLADYKNLVIVRTFSKSLSFAGMRLGYVVSAPELIQAIFTVKNSFNHFPADFLAQTAGIASCKAAAYYAENARLVAQERDSLLNFLRQRGWFALNSATNFVFAKKEGHAGSAVYKAVKQAGILIRHFDTPGIADFVRITIGTHEQMDLLKNVLEAL